MEFDEEERCSYATTTSMMDSATRRVWIPDDERVWICASVLEEKEDEEENGEQQQPEQFSEGVKGKKKKKFLVCLVDEGGENNNNNNNEDGDGDGDGEKKRRIVTVDASVAFECNRLMTKKKKKSRKEENNNSNESDENDESDDDADLMHLPFLGEATVLHALESRFAKNKIYTQATSSVILALNPWQSLPLYGQDQLRRYASENSNHSNSPHVFGVAANAYSAMMREKKSQSILISGESGAGKTETTKFIMQFLANVHHFQENTESLPPLPLPPLPSTTTTTIEQRILETNPILEAFGNAKTTRNDNSSRFGKFIRIAFDVSPIGGAVVGASVKTYLLEKSRVVHCGAGERTFHAFHQLLSVIAPFDPQEEEEERENQHGWSSFLFEEEESCPPPTWASFHLCKQAVAAMSKKQQHQQQSNSSSSSSTRRSLSFAEGAAIASTPDSSSSSSSSTPSTCSPLFVASVDRAGFEKTLKAMECIGLSKKEIQGCWQVLAAVLHLQAVQFESDEKNGEDNASSSSPFRTSMKINNNSNNDSPAMVVLDESLQSACSAIGCNQEMLIQVLQNRTVRAGLETIVKPMDKVSCEAARDAMAKALYSRLFSWLVFRINLSLKNTSDKSLDSPSSSSLAAVHILDIFGFESFDRGNGFEQLCINYANEKLQQQFCAYSIQQQQQEYEREGIAWEHIPLSNSVSANVCAVEALESVPHGVFSLLDEECRLPQGTDSGYASKLRGFATAENNNSSNNNATPFASPSVARLRSPFSQASPQSQQQQQQSLFGLGAPKTQSMTFCVRHFAVDVVYGCLGFLEKNRDVLSPDIVQFLGKATLAECIRVLNGVFDESTATTSSSSSSPARLSNPFSSRRTSSASGVGGAAGSSSSSSGGASTLASQFRGQLAELLATVSSTTPHYVRCINPCSKSKSEPHGQLHRQQQQQVHFDRRNVARQLKCGGAIEAVKVARAGYGTRFTHEQFEHRFACCCCEVSKESETLESRVLQMIQQLQLSSEEYAVGKSLVFLREETAKRLESLRGAALKLSVVCLQRFVRASRVRNEYVVAKSAVVFVESFLLASEKKHRWLEKRASVAYLQGRVRSTVVDRPQFISMGVAVCFVQARLVCFAFSRKFKASQVAAKSLSACFASLHHRRLLLDQLSACDLLASKLLRLKYLTLKSSAVAVCSTIVRVIVRREFGSRIVAGGVVVSQLSRLVQRTRYVTMIQAAQVVLNPAARRSIHRCSHLRHLQAVGVIARFAKSVKATRAAAEQLEEIRKEEEMRKSEQDDKCKEETIEEKIDSEDEEGTTEEQTSPMVGNEKGELETALSEQVDKTEGEKTGETVVENEQEDASKETIDSEQVDKVEGETVEEDASTIVENDERELEAPLSEQVHKVEEGTMDEKASSIVGNEEKNDSEQVDKIEGGTVEEKISSVVHNEQEDVSEEKIDSAIEQIEGISSDENNEVALSAVASEEEKKEEKVDEISIMAEEDAIAKTEDDFHGNYKDLSSPFIQENETTATISADILSTQLPSKADDEDNEDGNAPAPCLVSRRRVHAIQLDSFTFQTSAAVATTTTTATNNNPATPPLLHEETKDDNNSPCCVQDISEENAMLRLLLAKKESEMNNLASELEVVIMERDALRQQCEMFEDARLATLMAEQARRSVLARQRLDNILKEMGVEKLDSASDADDEEDFNGFGDESMMADLDSVQETFKSQLDYRDLHQRLHDYQQQQTGSVRSGQVPFLDGLICSSKNIHHHHHNHDSNSNGEIIHRRHLSLGDDYEDGQEVQDTSSSSWRRREFEDDDAEGVLGGKEESVMKLPAVVSTDAETMTDLTVSPSVDRIVALAVVKKETDQSEESVDVIVLQAGESGSEEEIVKCVEKEAAKKSEAAVQCDAQTSTMETTMQDAVTETDLEETIENKPERQFSDVGVDAAVVTNIDERRDSFSVATREESTEIDDEFLVLLKMDVGIDAPLPIEMVECGVDADHPLLLLQESGTSTDSVILTEAGVDAVQTESVDFGTNTIAEAEIAGENHNNTDAATQIESVLVSSVGIDASIAVETVDACIGEESVPKIEFGVNACVEVEDAQTEVESVVSVVDTGVDAFSMFAETVEVAVGGDESHLSIADCGVNASVGTEDAETEIDSTSPIDEAVETVEVAVGDDNGNCPSTTDFGVSVRVGMEDAETEIDSTSLVDAGVDAPTVVETVEVAVGKEEDEMLSKAECGITACVAMEDAATEIEEEMAAEVSAVAFPSGAEESKEELGNSIQESKEEKDLESNPAAASSPSKEEEKLFDMPAEKTSHDEQAATLSSSQKKIEQDIISSPPQPAPYDLDNEKKEKSISITADATSSLSDAAAAENYRQRAMEAESLVETLRRELEAMKSATATATATVVTIPEEEKELASKSDDVVVALGESLWLPPTTAAVSPSPLSKTSSHEDASVNKHGSHFPSPPAPAAPNTGSSSPVSPPALSEDFASPPSFPKKKSSKSVEADASPEIARLALENESVKKQLGSVQSELDSLRDKLSGLNPDQLKDQLLEEMRLRVEAMMMAEQREKNVVRLKSQLSTVMQEKTELESRLRKPTISSLNRARRSSQTEKSPSNVTSPNTSRASSRSSSPTPLPSTSSWFPSFFFSSSKQQQQQQDQEQQQIRPHSHSHSCGGGVCSRAAAHALRDQRASPAASKNSPSSSTTATTTSPPHSLSSSSINFYGEAPRWKI